MHHGALSKKPHNKQLRGFRHRQNPLSYPKSLGDLLHAVSLLESFHPAGGIDQLLLPGKERMAGGADFSADFRLGGTALEGVAAQAPHRHFLILGMDSFFHIFLLTGNSSTADSNVTR
jgi:hypothetical protein